MEQRFAAAFGLFALGITLGSFFQEMDSVPVQRLGRAIQLGIGLSSGLWALLLAVAPPQYDFAHARIGVSLVAAVVFASLFAGVVLVADKFGRRKRPD